jgi:hypothetical protein
LPFKRARTAFTGRPDFCSACEMTAMSLSIYVATWN